MGKGFTSVDEMIKWKMENTPEEFAKHPYWCPYCVRPDTIIPGDFKQISEIGVGEKVIGRNGFVRVLRTYKRPYEGAMYKIKAAGLQPIEVTPEHPILIAEGRMYRNKIHFDGFKWKLPSEVKEKHSNTNGDYLVVPKPPKFIKTRELDLNHYTTKIGLRAAKAKRVPLKFMLNEDTAWLLGLYVAEGNRSAKAINFSVGRSEKDLVKKVIAIGKEIGYSPCVVQASTTLRVEISSRILSRAFGDWCGDGAHNKQVPEFIRYHVNDEIVKSFIKGFADGDGYHDDTREWRGSEECMVTTSKKLALQLQLLFMRFNRLLSISPHKPGKVIEGRKIHALHESFELRAYNRKGYRNAQVKFFEKYALTPIHAIQTVPYSGLVCNIATSDNSYLVSNAVVHNCGTEFAEEKTRNDHMETCSEKPPPPPTYPTVPKYGFGILSYLVSLVGYRVTLFRIPWLRR
jgi:hypothetical protein